MYEGINRFYKQSGMYRASLFFVFGKVNVLTATRQKLFFVFGKQSIYCSWWSTRYFPAITVFLVLGNISREELRLVNL